MGKGGVRIRGVDAAGNSEQNVSEGEKDSWASQSQNANVLSLVVHCYWHQEIDTMAPVEPLDSVEPLALWTVSVLHEEITIVKSTLVKPDRLKGIQTSVMTSLPE